MEFTERDATRWYLMGWANARAAETLKLPPPFGPSQETAFKAGQDGYAQAARLRLTEIRAKNVT